MEIEFIENSKKDYWNKFILENKGNFLQSFEWGEFQENLSKKVWRILVKRGEKIVLATQVIEEKMKFKRYFYIPYGPIFSSEADAESLEFLLKEIKKIAAKEGAVFLRIEPIVDLPKTNISLKDSTKRLQPEKTMLVDLSRGEEELLQAFEKRTRYNIKLAEKKGVKINILNNYSKEFYSLLSKTKERQEFKSYSESYYEKLLNIEGNDFQTKIFLAEFEGKPIVATLALFFGDKVTTLHTGFNYDYRAIKAPYFVRWSIILEGKKLGKKECDFWGIDDKKWPGVTHLKRSFNGKEIKYGKGKEMIFNSGWYFLYNILRRIL
ncbi:MAG: peptidoglycan bridge formation glycyltransferase FemA/FemB family protein [Candidatus Nealsonbacteria bacterium]